MMKAEHAARQLHLLNRITIASLPLIDHNKFRQQIRSDSVILLESLWSEGFLLRVVYLGAKEGLKLDYETRIWNRKRA
jgi:hypothetical protein